MIARLDVGGSGYATDDVDAEAARHYYIYRGDGELELPGGSLIQSRASWCDMKPLYLEFGNPIT